jgi:hypothetical protein
MDLTCWHLAGKHDIQLLFILDGLQNDVRAFIHDHIVVDRRFSQNPNRHRWNVFFSGTFSADLYLAELANSYLRQFGNQQSDQLIMRVDV